MLLPSICRIVLVLTLAVAVLASAGENANADEKANAGEKADAKADSVTQAIADTTEFSQEHIFNVIGLVLPHNSLRNSKTLHNWPFFALAAPAWVSTIRLKRDINRAFTLKGFATYDLGFNGIGLRIGTSLELIHLLELGVQVNTGTALNYGETATFMGVSPWMKSGTLTAPTAPLRASPPRTAAFSERWLMWSGAAAESPSTSQGSRICRSSGRA
jgi:hypothetical protein